MGLFIVKIIFPIPIYKKIIKVDEIKLNFEKCF